MADRRAGKGPYVPVLPVKTLSERSVPSAPEAGWA